MIGLTHRACSGFRVKKLQPMYESKWLLLVGGLMVLSELSNLGPVAMYLCTE